MEGLEPETRAREGVKQTAGTMTPLHDLLAGAIDYAGLFPPASLGMDEAVQRFAAYRRSSHAGMLGRFVVPVAQLDACAASADALPSDARGTDVWNISALAGGDIAADLHIVRTFNASRHAGGRPRLLVDTLEFRADRPAVISTLPPVAAEMPVLFAEIPLETDPVPFLDVLSAAHMRAKVRTGGITPDAFPAPEHLARFVTACVRAGVPFKATAGLHHPLRGRYRLTYADAGPSGIMFGFLNVLLATALAAAGGSEDDVRRILEQEDPQTVRFEAEQVGWGAYRLPYAAVAAARSHFTTFGSCSFEEPVNDLQQMGLL